MIRVLCILIAVVTTYGADIYIGQIATGADTGEDCANAHSVSWFNANATGGNTYRICGTITGAVNTTALTIPASGGIGTELTVYFESNAILTCPQWNANGAIYASGKSNIVINGGVNGRIVNSDNGTYKGTKASSSGVVLSDCSYATIRNLTVTNIYENWGTNGATDTDGNVTWCISVTSTGNGHITIDNNRTRQARAGIQFGFTGNGGNSVDIRSNTTTDHCWGMYVTCNEDSNVVISNFIIRANDVSDCTHWGWPAATYHQDLIMISGAGIVTTNPIIVAGNKFHGAIEGGSVTAALYCTFDGVTSPGPAVDIYNNIFISENGGVMTGPCLAGKNIYNLWNNTIVLKSDKSVSGILLGNDDTRVRAYNNIICNAKYAFHVPSSPTPNVLVAENNLYFNTGDGTHFSGDYWGASSSWRDTFAAWQTSVGREHDTNGFNADPKFVSAITGDYRIGASSPAVGTGKAFNGVFSTDYNGETRGSSWDIGAYEYIDDTATPRNIGTLRVNNLKNL